MKTLIVLFALLGFTFNSNDVASLSQEGAEQVKKEVAEEFQVLEEDVSLQRPNLVYVDLGSLTEAGTATFTSCGQDCTEISIDFGSTLVQLIVEEDAVGI